MKSCAVVLTLACLLSHGCITQRPTNPYQKPLYMIGGGALALAGTGLFVYDAIYDTDKPDNGTSTSFDSDGLIGVIGIVTGVIGVVMFVAGALMEDGSSSPPSMIVPQRGPAPYPATPGPPPPGPPGTYPGNPNPPPSEPAPPALMPATPPAL